MAHTKASASTGTVPRPITLSLLILPVAALAAIPPDCGPCLRSPAAVCAIRTPRSLSLSRSLCSGCIDVVSLPRRRLLHQVLRTFQALSGAPSCAAVCWLSVCPIRLAALPPPPLLGLRVATTHGQHAYTPASRPLPSNSRSANSFSIIIINKGRHCAALPHPCYYSTDNHGDETSPCPPFRLFGFILHPFHLALLPGRGNTHARCLVRALRLWASFCTHTLLPPLGKLASCRIPPFHLHRCRRL